MPHNVDLNREYITTPEAAKRAGLSREYLTILLKKGTLEGFQLSREWFIYADSLQQFLAKPRKSGPKGPRKKPIPNHSATSSSIDTTKNDETDNTKSSASGV